jgi:hypothetical protein
MTDKSLAANPITGADCHLRVAVLSDCKQQMPQPSFDLGLIPSLRCRPRSQVIWGPPDSCDRTLWDVPASEIVANLE